MSQTLGINNGQQLTVNTDTSKIFLWDNRFDKGSYVNSTYVTATILAGTVVGMTTAGALVPFTSGASNGSQYIVGILNEDHVLEAGESKEIYFCVSGDVAEEMLLFQGSDNLGTVVGGRRVREKIAAETVGINLIASTDLTKNDNPQ
jgi:hypothetical protein